MKSVHIVVVGFVIAALAVACDRDDASSADEPEEATKAAEGDEEEDSAEPAELEEAGDSEAPTEIEQRGLDFFDEVAEAGLENIDDCDAVATTWRSMIDENEDLLADMSAMAAAMSAEQQTAFEKRNAERLGAFMDRMDEVTQACHEHDELPGLLEELSTR